MAKAPKALNIRAKRKPVVPVNDPGETGYQLNFGGGGVSRTYVGLYSHKGLQRFTECLLNFEAYVYKTELSPTESDSNIPLFAFFLTGRMTMIKIPTESNLYR
jgi:hypothetical protein